MTNDLIAKMGIPHGHLDAKDLTADEKKDLYALMMRYGATEALAYNRFFDKGFDEWELRGINQCKADFIRDNLDGVEDTHIRALLCQTDNGFYSALPLLSGLRGKLLEHMAPLGMETRVTVAKRFEDDDWKEWERVGIRHIIREFCQLHMTDRQICQQHAEEDAS